MTRQSAIDQAVRRGFGKLYDDVGRQKRMLRRADAFDALTSAEHKAVLMAWDRANPSFPMNKADHAGGLSAMHARIQARFPQTLATLHHSEKDEA